MALKDTVKVMRNLLQEIVSDLDKAENGNKAASQRVRTGTIRLEKVAKGYRRESIKTERSTGGSAKKKAKAKPAAKPAGKAAAKPASKPAAKSSKAPSKASKPAPAKSKSAPKRPTAKIRKK